MKSLIPFTLTALLGPLISTAPLQAQTWHTVLQFQFAPGQLAQGNSLAADALGNIFAAGYAGDAAQTDHGLVLTTDSTAQTWYLSDDTNPAPAQYASRVWRALDFDLNGSLYSAGVLTPKCVSCPSAWLVRKSLDGGLSWSTADSFQYNTGFNSAARGLTVDDLGAIYVAGSGGGAGAGGAENLHWIVRKSTNGGQTWTIVDDYYNSSKQGSPKWAIPARAFFQPGFGLFVVGASSSSQNGIPQTWTVRRSLNAGLTWSTVDLFQGSAGCNANAWGISSDAQGNLYVAGDATVATVVKHNTSTSTQWVIRKSRDGGNTWATVDIISVGANQIASAHDITRDTAGNMIAIGGVADASGVNHWIARRLNLLGQWQTIDDFQLAVGRDAQPQSAIPDSAGNVLVTGEADNATGGNWLVRKLQP